MARSIGGGAATGTSAGDSPPRTAGVKTQTSAEHVSGAAGPWIDVAETRALPRKLLTLSSGAGVALWLAGPADAGGVPAGG